MLTRFQELRMRADECFCKQEMKFQIPWEKEHFLKSWITVTSQEFSYRMELVPQRNVLWSKVAVTNRYRRLRYASHGCWVLRRWGDVERTIWSSQVWDRQAPVASRLRSRLQIISSRSISPLLGPQNVTEFHITMAPEKLNLLTTQQAVLTHSRALGPYGELRHLIFSNFRDQTEESRSLL
jgi:hypothetical protein